MIGMIITFFLGTFIGKVISRVPEKKMQDTGVQVAEVWTKPIHIPNSKKDFRQTLMNFWEYGSPNFFDVPKK